MKINKLSIILFVLAITYLFFVLQYNSVWIKKEAINEQYCEKIIKNIHADKESKFDIVGIRQIDNIIFVGYIKTLYDYKDIGYLLFEENNNRYKLKSHDVGIVKGDIQGVGYKHIRTVNPANILTNDYYIVISFNPKLYEIIIDKDIDGRRSEERINISENPSVTVIRGSVVGETNIHYSVYME